VAISTKTAVLIGSGVLVLGAGIGIAGVASADAPGGPGPTTAPTIAPAPPGDPVPPSDPVPPVDPAPRGNPAPDAEVPGWPLSAEQEEIIVQTLSSMLGVQEAEVRAVLEQFRADYAVHGPAALDQWLDQAVEAGILTPEEADALRQAAEMGVGVGTR
jgi:hypothetical protein